MWLHQGEATSFHGLAKDDNPANPFYEIYEMLGDIVRKTVLNEADDMNYIGNAQPLANMDNFVMYVTNVSQELYQGCKWMKITGHSVYD